MSNDFSKAVNRRGTNSVKWNEETLKDVCGNKNAIAAWVADMDLETAPAIHNRLINDANLGVIGYPKFEDKINNAFISFLKRRHNWIVQKDHVLFAQGMLHSITLSVNLFTNEGDKILLPYPSYPPFETIININNRVNVPFHLTYENNSFKLDRDAFKDMCKGIKCILFCSPHNPTSIVFSKEDLRFVLECAKENDAIIICDEIHADLVHPSKTHYPLGLVNEEVGARVITCMAPSKSFNIAGEHASFVLFSDLDDCKAFQKAQERLFISGPAHLAGNMCLEAYTNSDDFNKELCAHLESNANFIEEYLKENLPMLHFMNGGATFVSLIDCSAIYPLVLKDKEKNPEAYCTSSDLSHFFGHYGGICLNDGTTFGKEYYEFVRINFGTSRDELLKVLSGMKKAIEIL